MKYTKIFYTLSFFSLLLVIENCGGNIWRQRAQKDLDQCFDF